MKIMVVDDENAVQRLFEQRFRRELRSGTVEFIFAFSGEEALSYLENAGTSNLGLILSDINMPGMSGLKLLQTIHEKYPDLTIFMITAYGDEEKKQQAKNFGADEYFIKPIDFRNLKEKILT